MPLLDLCRELGHAYAADPRGRAGEVLVDESLREAHGLEDLRALVALHRGDAHLGHDLDDALGDGLLVGLDGLLVRGLGQEARLDHVVDGLEDEVGVDRRDSVADQHREVVDLSGLPGLEDYADPRAGLVADEVVVEAGHREEGGDGDHVLVDAPVREDEDVRSLGEGLVGLGAYSFHRLLEGRSGIGLVGSVDDGDRDRLEALARYVTQLLQLVVVDEGARELDLLRRLGCGMHEVALGAHEDLGAYDDLLADRVDGRVRDLGEELLEVVVQELGLVREDGEGAVVAHRADGIDPVPHHGNEDLALVLVGVAEGPLEALHGLVIALGALGGREAGPRA